MFILSELKRIPEELKKNWPNFFWQFIIFVIIGFSVTILISSSLKPQTDIDVKCKINESNTTNYANYSLDILFKNNADFAGKNLYIYIWGITSKSWGSDHKVSEHCKIIKEEEIDYKSRLKIFCDFIPPNTEFRFGIDTNLNEEIIRTKKIKIEWWGETTPYEKEFIDCDVL